MCGKRELRGPHLSTRNQLPNTLANKIRRSPVQPGPQSSPATRNIQWQGRAAHTVISMARSGTTRNTQQGKILGKWWRGGRNKREGRCCWPKILLVSVSPRPAHPECSLWEQNDFPVSGERRRCYCLVSTCCHTLNVNLLITMGRNCGTCSISTRKFNLPTTDVRQVSFSPYNSQRHWVRKVT